MDREPRGAPRRRCPLPKEEPALVGGHRARRAWDSLRRLWPLAAAAVGCLSLLLMVAVVKAGTSGRSVVVGGTIEINRTGAGPTETETGTDPPSLPASAAPEVTPPTAAATAPGTLPATHSRPPAPAPTAARPPVVTEYEAEAPQNGLAGTRTFTCPGCSGGEKVGDIGRGMGTLQFNGVAAGSDGPAAVTLVYVNGESTRTAQLSVDGGVPVSLNFPGTGGWSTVGTLNVTISLRSGANTLRLSNVVGPAPDFDKIVVKTPAS
jgi:Alpha-galactosidase, CBM13 domain